EKFFPYRLGALGESSLRKVDARDPYLLYEVGQEVVGKARRGEGPTVLWCELDRLCSHTSSDDQRVYRAAEDIACDQMRDPIETLARHLITNGQMTRDEWEQEL